MLYSIKKDILDNIDLDIILNDFASRNAEEVFHEAMKHIVDGIIVIWILFEVMKLLGNTCYIFKLLTFCSVYRNMTLF
jgi:hypothetical protein